MVTINNKLIKFLKPFSKTSQVSKKTRYLREINFYEYNDMCNQILKSVRSSEKNKEDNQTCVNKANYR